MRVWIHITPSLCRDHTRTGRKQAALFPPSWHLGSIAQNGHDSKQPISSKVHRQSERLSTPLLTPIRWQHPTPTCPQLFREMPNIHYNLPHDRERRRRETTLSPKPDRLDRATIATTRRSNRSICIGGRGDIFLFAWQGVEAAWKQWSMHFLCHTSLHSI